MTFTHREPSLPVRMVVGLFFAVVTLTAAAQPVRDPKLKSSSVLIIDQSDSTVLYSRHADVAMPIASITKLMTALVVLQAKQSLDEPIEVTREDVATGKGA